MSLVASPSSELVQTHVFDPGEKIAPVVRSAVIYGANAAGKSNVLHAVQFAQSIVLGSTQAGQLFGVMPFAFVRDTKEKPSEFEFVFVENAVRYHYGFALTRERIVREWLIAYPKRKPQRWFERDYDEESGKYTWTLGANFRGEKSQRNTWRDSTRDNALFLSTAVQLNNEQLHPVFSWFQNKLGVVTINNSMNMALSMELLNDPERYAILNQFIRAADVGIEKLEFREERGPGAVININLMPGGHQVLPGFRPAPPMPAPKFGRVLAHHKQNDSDDLTQLDLFTDESEGTRKIFQFAGGWIKALQDGATLLVDELDRGLHPLMTRFLVQLFHDEKRNARGAQLVFTTHDTTLLDKNLFRRDQIWFVEKDKHSSTRLYPLLEYSPRKDEALERGYLKGRYGAIPFLSPINFDG